MHLEEPSRKPGWAVKLVSASFFVVGVIFTVLYAANVTRPWGQIEGELGPCTKGKGVNSREYPCSATDEMWVNVVLLGVPLLLVALSLTFVGSFIQGR